MALPSADIEKPAPFVTPGTLCPITTAPAPRSMSVRSGSPAAVSFAAATLGINVVANFVSAAFDISNTFPRVISFKRGGYIAAAIALLAAIVAAFYPHQFSPVGPAIARASTSRSSSSSKLPTVI